MGSPEGQPQNSFKNEEPSELPPDIIDHIANKIEQSDGLLLQSRGILELAAKEA